MNEDETGRDGADLDAIAIVSQVGHELRSPLTSIRGFTSLLRNRWDRLGDDDKRMMIDQIHADAERVTRLINELLDISRIETGRLTLAPQPLRLGDLAAGVVETIRRSTPKLTAEVVFPSDGLEVAADRDKVEQVLLNLVENAVKYGDPVGLVIRGDRDGDDAVVTVRDHGPGIVQGDLERVFDRWYQREDGRPTGTGLGLWISRALAEAHGGTLTATSPPGEGATFTLRLPLNPGAESV